MSLSNRATDPQQYDKEVLYWERERAMNSPWMDFYKGYILPSPEELKEKNVLDIGSGTGWLLEEIRNRGAKKVIGIEPSKNNVQIAQEQYPNVQTFLSSLEEYEDTNKYDYIFALMSFLHIADVSMAMKKVATLLESKGSFRMIVPGFEYAKTPRFGYEIEVESINDDAYAVRTERPTVATVDMVRKTVVYISAAGEAGLLLEKNVPILPTNELVVEKPQYEQFKNKPIAHMLWFTH